MRNLSGSHLEVKSQSLCRTCIPRWWGPGARCFSRNQLFGVSKSSLPDLTMEKGKMFVDCRFVSVTQYPFFLTLPWSNMCKKKHDVFLYSVIIMSNIVHQWGQDNCTMKILANIWTDHVKAKGICPISYKSKEVCQKVVITKIRNPTWLISFVHQHQQPFIVCWERFPRNWSWTDISQKWQLLTVIVLRSQNDASQRLFST